MQAYKISRLQEEVFEAQAKTWGLRANRPQAALLPTPVNNKIPNFQKNSTPNPTFKKTIDVGENKNNHHNTVTGGRRLTSAEMNEKRAKGLCFFCDEKYTMGHVCKAKKQLYLIDVVEEEERVEEVELIQEQEHQNATHEFMTISLQAYTGVTGYQTLKVTGYHEKRPLQVLIDTGSTHNFIDQEVAKKLGCKAEPITEQSVCVADGRKMQTAHVCKNLQWL